MLQPVIDECKSPKRSKRNRDVTVAGSSNRKIRIDSAHHAVPESQLLPNDREWISRAGGWLRTKSLTHIILFGLLTFLLGQVVLVWSFLAGHYTSWSIANMISIAGVTLMMLAIAATLRNFNQRLDDLAHLVGRQRQDRSTRQTARKSLRKM